VIRSAHRLQLRPYLLDLGASALIVLAPFVVLLSFHGYSYFTPEVLAIGVAALGVAALLALLLGFASPLIRAVVFAGLIALFIDMHVDLPTSWSSFVVTALFLATVAVLATILSLLREHANAILIVIFVTLIALTLMRGSSNPNEIVSEHTATAASGNVEPPLLVHLLLDEHIGVEGLPQEIPAARDLRTALIDFYTSRGFRLFGGAYSQYANTYNSIANLMNFTSREVSHPYLMHGEDAKWNLKESAYFQMLQQRGYRLHVYQSTYMDLCHAEGVQPQECTTYPVTSLAMLKDLKLSTYEKARAIANAIVTQSQILLVGHKVYERVVRGAMLHVGWQLPEWRWQEPLFGPLPMPKVFDRLSDDIVRHPRGHAFFAHLLLPHYPYVFDETCHLRPSTSDWMTNHIASIDGLVFNTADSRVQKYELYAQQTRCLLTLIDGLLDDLDSRGLLDNAIVVVNGDHGSRIPEHFPSGVTLTKGVLTDSDFSDTFSTLYAIRAPGVPSGYDEAPLSLVELLNHHFGGEPLRAPDSCRVFLLVENGGGLTGVEPKFCAP
jgi:sulfatase-like protein